MAERRLSSTNHWSKQKKGEKKLSRYERSQLNYAYQRLREAGLIKGILKENLMSDTPVKNDANEYFHLACADRNETLTVLKKSELNEGDVCKECNNELVYVDPDVDEEDD